MKIEILMISNEVNFYYWQRLHDGFSTSNWYCLNTFPVAVSGKQMQQCCARGSKVRGTSHWYSKRRMCPICISSGGGGWIQIAGGGVREVWDGRKCQVETNVVSHVHISDHWQVTRWKQARVKRPCLHVSSFSDINRVTTFVSTWYYQMRSIVVSVKEKLSACCFLSGWFIGTRRINFMPANHIIPYENETDCLWQTKISQHVWCVRVFPLSEKERMQHFSLLWSPRHPKDGKNKGHGCSNIRPVWIWSEGVDFWSRVGCLMGCETHLNTSCK